MKFIIQFRYVIFYIFVFIRNNIVLYVGLHQLFDEFEIKTASCPCLTRPPYNLAAVGKNNNNKLTFLTFSVLNIIHLHFNRTIW